MKLPAKIEYACKAVLELSLRYHENRPVTLDAISEAQKIPPKFLVQIFLHLSSSHIVQSARGAAGGYFLARPPSRITISDVIRAVDSRFFAPAGLDLRQEATGSERLLFAAWDEMNELLRKQLDIPFDTFAARLRPGETDYQI